MVQRLQVLQACRTDRCLLIVFVVIIMCYQNWRIAVAFILIFMMFVVMLVQPGLVHAKKLALVLLDSIENPQVSCYETTLAKLVVELRHMRLIVTVAMTMVVVAVMVIVTVGCSAKS